MSNIIDLDEYRVRETRRADKEWCVYCFTHHDPEDDCAA